MTIGTDVAHAASKAIDLTELTVETVQAGFASGAFTAEQLTRACLGRIDADEVAAEMKAQLERFTDLVGYPPTVVNSHQHAQIFRPVGG